ncbi:hypothetical protein MFLAVUS_006049 [Mucor flavus]|uniref:COP9 signalosome complex subunit 3 n=1 Tax=Mucor flavus TaxID=439312 RepID=A0ABP9Z0E3_9FUNG
MQQPEAESSKPIPSIDEVIAIIISVEDSGHKKILDKLNLLNSASLLSYTTDGLDPLTVLNPKTHSLAYLYFITERCQRATSQNALQLYQLLYHFIQVYDPRQVHLAPKRFTLIAKALLKITSVLKKPLLPLQSLARAIERFVDTPNTLTSLHAPFIQACILAKNYSFPLLALDHDIEVLDVERYDIDIQSFLQYYYYGSIVYIANKNFERALDFLSIVISSPTQKAISAIQIAAYKKFVLVSLIYQGQVSALPKYTAQGVEKVCRTQSQPYLNLLKDFNETDLDMFQENASSASALFESDNHLGLVKQCFQALRRKKIKELTNVYITVGLNEMATKIGTSPQELELILIEMIYQNQISATISVTDQHVKMVHFTDEEDKSQVNLEDRIFQISAVNDRVSYMDKLEGLNRDFQTKFMTLSANGGQMTTTPYDEDFDLPLDDDTKIFN